MKKRVKRDMSQRAFKQGYNQAVRGHSREICPFESSLKRTEWLGGWRQGRADYIAGYHGAAL